MSNGHCSDLDRRKFLSSLAAGGAFFTVRGAFAQALVETPAQTLGPFYPDRLPLDQDNDLLLIQDDITPAVGVISWISGRVLDSSGRPIRGALVEIWQANAAGRYHHPVDQHNAPLDPNLTGAGRCVTNEKGDVLATKDYAVPGHNAFVLQTNEPRELVGAGNKGV